MVTVLLLILGFFAGLLGALTGIGGGVLLTPILALHFGIPIRQAIGASLVAVITTSAASSSVHLQRHTTDIRLGMTLELATAFGAAVTAYLVGYFNRNALEGLFAAFLLYSAITILTKGGKVKPLEEESALIVDPTVIPPYEPKRYPLGLAASLVAGALSGLLGIGGGPIKVPVMYIFMNVPLMVATATSNFMIGVTAAASAIVYYRRGDILVELAAPLGGGRVPGITSGRAHGSAHSHQGRGISAGRRDVLSCRTPHRSSLAGVVMSQVREPEFDRAVALGAAHRSVQLLLHHADGAVHRVVCERPYFSRD